MHNTGWGMKNMKNKITIVALLSFSCILLSSCNSISKEEYQSVMNERDNLQNQYNTVIAVKDDLQLKYDNVSKDLEQAKKQIEEFAALQKKYSELSDSEIEAQKANSELKAEQDRQAKEKLLEEEKKKAEKEAAKLAAEAEKQEKLGYDTGITFNQLARTPDDYIGLKVKFSGKVIQVIEGDGETNLRIAINDDYNHVILVYYDPSILKSRVLENDNITFYGISQGLYTYESTMGGKITVPLVSIDKIEIN